MRMLFLLAGAACELSAVVGGIFAMSGGNYPKAAAYFALASYVAILAVSIRQVTGQSIGAGLKSNPKHREAA